MTDNEYFEGCVRRITQEIIPILQYFPPKVPNDSEGILSGSIDLLLYRNLLFALEFCFKDNDSRLSIEQVDKLRSMTRKQVIPAYVNFFKNHFCIDGHGQASSFFYVRQENNASWAKLIWSRIKEIYYEKEAEKSEESHELGVKVSSGVLDVLARLLEIFFPTEEIVIQSNCKEKEFSSKSLRKFSIRRFELLNFDLRREEPEILEAILQRALIERYDPLSAKNAFYILNRIVAFSRETSKFELCNNDENIFIWSNNDSKLPQIWEQFIVAYGSVQESQIHLVRPLLPVIKDLIGEMKSGWWRVLLQRGLCNDSVPIRRLVLHSILQQDDLKVFCTPEGLDFCLEDLLQLGLDANASFLVSHQHIIEGETGPSIDFGECTSLFFSKIIEIFYSKSIGHGRAIIRELFVSLDKIIKSPVALIYILKSFSLASKFPALEDVELSLISKISSSICLHNQRARLLVKRQLVEIFIGFSNPEGISFAQLISTLNCLLSESLSIGELTTKKKEFAQISIWLDETFGPTFLKENLSISIERFYRLDGSKEKARMLSLLAVFSLGSGDGRFVNYSRPVFEQLSFIANFDHPQEATSAFTLFLTLNETVRSVLSGEGDLLSQMGMNSRIFDWLEFIDGALFGNDMRVKVDYNATCTFLDVFGLLIERASETDQNQLIQFLDIHVFSLINFLNGHGEINYEDVDIDVGFKRLLTVLSAMTALASILKKLRAVGHLQPDLITPESIQKIIRFKLERPGGLSETEWDQWPDFVTAFTASKWKCVESMAESLVIVKDPKDELLSVLASCLQALEVSKYGGTLAILKCMSTLFDLILGMSNENDTDDRQISSLMGLAVQNFKNVLNGGSETQRWFDVYAEAFIILFFRQSILKASEYSSAILEYLQDIFDFILTDIGPKRRGIVSLMSSKMGLYWIKNTEALSSSWRSQLINLLIYGPIRSSSDESVAAKINNEHVPDSDYQVRVHAISVLNQLKDISLVRDFLIDLIGQQESRIHLKKRMFPGDFGHRIKLRTWSAILFLIGIFCNLSSDFEKEFVETDLLPSLWRLVGEEHMSSTRLFIEWCLSRLYLMFSTLILDDFMSSRIQYCDVSANLLISMISISLNMTKKMKNVDDKMTMEQFLPRISDFILPLLVHNNHTVRMHAIHAFKQFESEKKAVGISSNVLGYKLLAGFIETADHCQKFIRKLESDVFVSEKGLDPIEDFTIDWVFGRLMRLGGVDGEAIEYYAFMNFYDKIGNVQFYNINESISISGNSEDDTLISNSKTTTESSIEVTELFKDFQTKIDIYSPFAMDEVDDGTESDTMGTRPTSPTILSTALTDGQRGLQTEIIVIGSLLDKLPNLAGLARTSEIFGVKTLYVPDLAALSSPDFLNVAMTAEKWLDIRQLAVKDIPNFLETIKTEQGFSVVALEQTSNSVSLQSYSFPKKTCIVLGNERQGIPAEILHLVDDCVEIPQFGRVRSLNVHVSGSLAIWKAREQDLI